MIPQARLNGEFLNIINSKSRGSQGALVRLVAGVFVRHRESACAYCLQAHACRVEVFMIPQARLNGEFLNIINSKSRGSQGALVRLVAGVFVRHRESACAYCLQAHACRVEVFMIPQARLNGEFLNIII